MKTEAISTQPQPRVLLSVTETCQALSIGQTTFFLLVARGALKTVKIGRKTLVHADEVKRFADGLKARSS
jgi:excisionase family DNA binding protein